MRQQPRCAPSAAAADRLHASFRGPRVTVPIERFRPGDELQPEVGRSVGLGFAAPGSPTSVALHRFYLAFNLVPVVRCAVKREASLSLVGRFNVRVRCANARPGFARRLH